MCGKGRTGIRRMGGEECSQVTCDRRVVFIGEADFAKARCAATFGSITQVAAGKETVHQQLSDRVTIDFH